MKKAIIYCTPSGQQPFVWKEISSEHFLTLGYKDNAVYIHEGKEYLFIGDIKQFAIILE